MSNQHQCVVHTKLLVAYFGEYFSKVFLLNKDGFTIDSLTFDHNDQGAADLFVKFIKQYKKHKICFIIDTDNVSFSKEQIKLLDGISIGDFIRKDPDALYAYQIINKEFVQVASLCDKNLECFITFGLRHCAGLTGIYCLTLNTFDILHEFKHPTDNAVIAITTISSGIRFILIQDGFISKVRYVERSIDKTASYIAGAIEAGLADLLSSAKNPKQSQSIILTSECIAKEIQNNKITIITKYPGQQDSLEFAELFLINFALKTNKHKMTSPSLDFISQSKNKYVRIKCIGRFMISVLLIITIFMLGISYHANNQHEVLVYTQSAESGYYDSLLIKKGIVPKAFDLYIVNQFINQHKNNLDILNQLSSCNIRNIVWSSDYKQNTHNMHIEMRAIIDGMVICEAVNKIPGECSKTNSTQTCIHKNDTYVINFYGQ